MDLFSDAYIKRDEVWTVNQCARESRTSDSFNVVRPVYVQEELDKEADYHKPSKSLPEKCGGALRACGLNECVKNFLPITHWLPQYSFRRDILGDIISGCTVAVMHIPQGMAYAMLGGVPPVIGLYMAFFPVLIYTFFGTSKHVSMGTFAVACLMTGKAISQFADTDSYGNLLNTNGTTTDSAMPDGPHYSPIDVATAVCFLVGVYQTVMWVFRLGAMSSLLSESLVSGFITGATIHVMTSQLKDLFGIKVGKHKGSFQIVMTLVDVAMAIPHLNIAALVISIISIVVMTINNEVLRPWVNKISKVPIPIELIVVIAGTLTNKYFDIHSLYGVTLVGHIPTGIPLPQLPHMELLPRLAVDSFTITMVSYTITMSMALIFATKDKYEVEPNQELLAMGAGNIFASFFSCMPFCASLSRSSIQYNAGGKSQLASLVSCSLLVCVMLWIGPFFEDLPKAVLASIIVVALKGMLMQGKEIVRFWKLSKLDALVWLITCATVIFIDIDIGLLVGIIASVGTLFIRAQSPYTCLLGRIPNTDIYLDVNRYKAAVEIPGIKIFHYCGGLNFASKSGFKTTLFRKINLPNTTKPSHNFENGLLKKSLSKESTSFEYSHTDNKILYLIMDLTAMCYVDAGGVSMLRTVYQDLERMGIQMLLARANGPILEMLERFDKLESGEDKLHFTAFPSVHDATLYAVSQMQLSGPIPNITTQ